MPAVGARRSSIHGGASCVPQFVVPGKHNFKNKFCDNCKQQRHVTPFWPFIQVSASTAQFVILRVGGGQAVCTRHEFVLKLQHLLTLVHTAPAVGRSAVAGDLLFAERELVVVLQLLAHLQVRIRVGVSVSVSVSVSVRARARVRVGARPARRGAARR